MIKTKYKLKYKHENHKNDKTLHKSQIESMDF